RNGVLMLAALLAATAAITLAIVLALRPVSLGWLVEALLATPLLAQKQLGQAVEAVAGALRVSLDSGRAAVAHIVGRDTEALDESGIARAAIESLAENTSDGIVAPLFWLLLLGLPGIALYKAINTADSMVGHRDERYAEFGWASAKLDDLVNIVPSRLTAALLAAAAALWPGFDGKGAWHAARRDSARHFSPNAGWPEAAMAGALGLGLGGPNSYRGRIVDLPPMGEGRPPVASDINRALTLYRATLFLLLGLPAVLVLLLS
ncbi:MAG: adenosylcobinamide-phosphate synthase CbiB, partial [Cucumibacter sp.]